MSADGYGFKDMRIYRDHAIDKDFFWYEPGEFIFRREHLFFALEHWDLFAQGRYPPEPTSDFIEIASISTIGPSWKSASNIKAEIDYRLKSTKKAGETLIHCVNILGVDRYDYLPPIAQSALDYITGWRRRSMPYGAWVKQRKYRNRVLE